MLLCTFPVCKGIANKATANIFPLKWLLFACLPAIDVSSVCSAYFTYGQSFIVQQPTRCELVSHCYLMWTSPKITENTWHFFMCLFAEVCAQIFCSIFITFFHYWIFIVYFLTDNYLLCLYFADIAYSCVAWLYISLPVFQMVRF